MWQRTKVYAGFPGVGKSNFFKNNQAMLKISDSDSSLFSWVYNEDKVRTRNPEFPANYIAHIKSLISKDYDVVFVSTHSEVIEALIESGIQFEVVYPNRDLKEEYLRRYRERGSDEAFINLLDSKWDMFIDSLENLKDVQRVVLVDANAYMADMFSNKYN